VIKLSQQHFASQKPNQNKPNTKRAPKPPETVTPEGICQAEISVTSSPHGAARRAPALSRPGSGPPGKLNTLQPAVDLVIDDSKSGPQQGILPYWMQFLKAHLLEESCSKASAVG